MIQDDDNNGFNSQSYSIPSSLDSHVSADTPSPSLISGEIFFHTPKLNMDNKQPIEPPPQLNKPRQLVRAYETQIIDSSVEKVNNVEKSKEDTLTAPEIKTRQTKLFEITLKYIRERSAQDSEYSYNFGNIMKDVKTRLDFIQTIYKHSNPVTNETFW